MFCSKTKFSEFELLSIELIRQAFTELFSKDFILKSFELIPTETNDSLRLEAKARFLLKEGIVPCRFTTEVIKRDGSWALRKTDCCAELHTNAEIYEFKASGPRILESQSFPQKLRAQNALKEKVLYN